MQLEKMDIFFERRLDGYETHMLETIEGAREFYPFTASCLPKKPHAHILDLGCGTGLELNWYFMHNPTAKVTGIDLSEGMLAVLKEKFYDKELELLCGSYFTHSFPEVYFDGAVSVESLHHFTREEKLPLYTKLCRSLKSGGSLILTDYFALSDEEECTRREELLRMKAEQGLETGEFYHYDTPLTVEHETQALLAAGFNEVQVLKNWGATYTLKAVKW